MPKKTNKTTPALRPSFNELRGGPHEPEVWMVMDELSGYYPKSYPESYLSGPSGAKERVKVA